MKQYKYKINGNLYNVTVNDPEDNIARVEVNGIPFNVELEKKPKAEAPKPVVRPAAPVAKPAAPAAAAPAAAPAASASSGAKKATIKSPLPGVILDIRVKEGDEVKKGQTVIILEAMKMENSINAECDGKIAAIKVSKGESILEGTYLIVIE